MRTLKISCLLLLLFSIQSSLLAQDKLNIKFGKVKPEDFDVKSALIDSSTNAVVVADVGKSSFIANSTELTFSLIYTEKKRIKIINKNGFDAATITIPLYVVDNRAEELEDLDAFTYNLENGKVVQTKVDKSSVFTEKRSKNWIYKKFTFPALKEGSIIEYSYEVKSDFFFNLQPWIFQGEYPVLWSQYEAGIPEFYKYVTLSQGYQPFFINKVINSSTSFSFTEHVAREESFSGAPSTSSGLNTFKLDGNIEYHTWVMKNVPALKEEPFTTTVHNSIAKIEFQLNQVAFPHSIPKNYMDNWEKVASDLMLDEEFGVSINRANNWLDDEVERVVKNAATQKEKAQKIFEYVRDNFTCNDINRIYVTTNLRDVFKNKSGSVADINMLMIAMLKNQKINVNPVILSTRDHGFTHEIYPLIDRYNYVVAKVVIDDKDVYLDATIRQLAFGRLPSKVYNGQGREISKSLAMPVFFTADSLKESGMTMVIISNLEKGGVEGSFSQNLGVYESMKIRNKMTKTLPEDFKKSLQQQYPEEIVIDNVQLDSLKLLNEPVGLKFDLKFKTFVEDDIVYFSPMLGEAIKKNPFSAAERFYPVEMPYTVDDIYTLSMEIPKGYKVDELPKSVRLNLNEDEGMFEYLISLDKDYVQMRCRLQLRRANYLNEDYQTLRDFYTYIIKKEAEQIVFKKVK
ncbi:MAG: transglutaminase domain-containing protein [Ferruginibacter sp.]